MKKPRIRGTGAYLSRITNVLQCFNSHSWSNSVCNTSTPITPPWSTTISTIRPNVYHYSNYNKHKHIDKNLKIKANM